VNRISKGRFAALFVAVTLLLGAAVTMMPGAGVSGSPGAALPAPAAENGFVGPGYGTSTTAPTGQKPQSKLWVADGIWWGALFDGVSRDFHIFRYDWAVNGWSDTGVLIDERTDVYMDALWDGQHLYVVSAGSLSTLTTHSPRLIRYSYAAGEKTWSRDAGYPITPMGDGGVEAAVITKDSASLLWATYTQGSKVYVVHSTPGNDRLWAPRYILPSPSGQSTVSPDDISAIVSFDGNKVGVLWSNQNVGVETMYWAWHRDGTSDQLWTVKVAYQQPQGADDHINIKSLVGDSSGRVYAVAKSSATGATQPTVNLLVLDTAGGWSATPIWKVADNISRAIVQIDTQAREVYVFAAGPCCMGGTIYYKKSGLDHLQFAPGLGTPFITSSAHPEPNNPTSTKQNVNGATGLLVMAGDDQSRTYLYNRLALGETSDTPPETTITSDPAATTTTKGATFAFTSSKAGSTFACQLDGAPAQACTSPQSYTGLAKGAHTFTVTAIDRAGIDDPTAATHSWTVGVGGGATIFSDDFSSRNFTAGGWGVRVGAAGTATVLTNAVQPRSPGARLLSTRLTDSSASIRKTFAPQQRTTLTWDARVAAASTSQVFALAKIYASGTRVLTLVRNGSDGALSVRDVDTTVPTSATLSTGMVARLTVAAVQGTTDSVTVSIDGLQVFSSSSMNLGSAAFTAVQMGDDAKRRTLDYRVDNVQVTS